MQKSLGEEKQRLIGLITRLLPDGDLIEYELSDALDAYAVAFAKACLQESKIDPNDLIEDMKKAKMFFNPESYVNGVRVTLEKFEANIEKLSKGE